MKRITHIDLQNMYEPVPQHLMDNIDNVLSSLDDREERTIVKKKMSVSLVLAAMLILASMTALAMSNLNLFRNMTDTTAPIQPLSGAENMIETNLGGVENEYVTLTVEEAVYDGQSVMTLVHITPKNIEEYAMLNTSLQDTPDDLYMIEHRPVEVNTDKQELEINGSVYVIINEPKRKVLMVDGEEVAIPHDLNTAMDMGFPVYMNDRGVMYYADWSDFEVTGRKDGRSCIDYRVSMSIDGADTEKAEALGEGNEDFYSMTAEEQPDGSVLVWIDRNTFESLPETISIKISSSITVDGQEIPLDDLTFDLSKSDSVSRISLIPVDGKIGDNVVIHSAEISFTKLRGNLIVEYSYETSDEDDMGITMRIYDTEGNRITVGSGMTEKIGENRYREQVEIQALDQIPEKLILEAKVIGGEVLGRCECLCE